MKSLFYFMLGLCLIILTSATTVSVMTIKPATPKSTITIECRSHNVQSHIIKYSKSGYIFKNFIAGAYYDYDGLLVLEKY